MASVRYVDFDSPKGVKAKRPKLPVRSNPELLPMDVHVAK